jgi:hypothetical protein
MTFPPPAASIASAFESSRCRDDLSFGHHKQVAAFLTDEAEAPFLFFGANDHGLNPRRSLGIACTARAFRSAGPDNGGLHLSIASHVGSAESANHNLVVRAFVASYPKPSRRSGGAVFSWVAL